MLVIQPVPNHMAHENGKGDFIPLSIVESGFFVPGNGKAMVKLRGSNGKLLIAASQNRGPLKAYKSKQPTNFIALLPTDASAIVKYKNGTVQKVECYYGASFLSQSGRFLNVANTVMSAEITDFKGNKRTVAAKPN